MLSYCIAQCDIGAHRATALIGKSRPPSICRPPYAADLPSRISKISGHSDAWLVDTPSCRYALVASGAWHGLAWGNHREHYVAESSGDVQPALAH